jgi:transposase
VITVPPTASIFLCTLPVDLRKSFDGLGALVESVFRQRVFDGHLFLFVNKRRDRLKAIWWDRDGLAIFYKRLEKGCFELPRNAQSDSHVTLDPTALAMLLGGVPLATPRRPRYARSA